MAKKKVDPLTAAINAGIAAGNKASKKANAGRAAGKGKIFNKKSIFANIEDHQRQSAPAPPARAKTTPGIDKRPGAAFGPMPGSGPAMQPQRREANKKVRDAKAKLPKDRDVPRLPILTSYTPAQKKEITKRYVAYVQAKVKEGKTPDEVISGRNLEAPEAREFLHKVYGLSTTATRKRENDAIRERNPDLLRYATPNVQAKGGEPKKEGMKFGGLTKIGGVVPVPGLHQLGFTVSAGLHELQRPSSFVTGAVMAGREGKGLGLKEGWKNFKTQKISGSDLLRDSGSGNTVSAIAGGGFDILTNPVNLVGGGIAIPAAKLTKEAQAASNIARGLREAGNVEKATQYEAKAAKLADKAATLPSNRGTHFTFGTPRHNVSTSGETSAKMYGALRVPQVAKGIRETTPYQAVATRLHAGFRPAGLTPREWEDFRHAQRQAAGKTETGRTYFNRQGQAANRALAGDAAKHRAVVNALERAPKPKPTAAPGELPPLLHGDKFSLADLGSAAEREVAEATKRLLGGMGDREVAANLLNAASKREDYVTHILTPEARKAYKKASKGRGGRNVYASQRDDDRVIAEINDELIKLGHSPKFQENVGAIIAERGGRSETILAHKQLQDDMIEKVSQPFTGVENLRGIDDVYIAGPKGLRKVPSQKTIPGEKDIVEAKKALEAGERLVTMPRVIGEPTLRGPLAHRSVELNEREIVDLSHGFDSMMGKVKSGLTVMNAPAYQMRNLAGDIFNSRLAGTRVQDLKDGIRVIEQRGARNRSQAKELGDKAHTPKGEVDLGHGRTVTNEQLIRDMEERRVIGTGFNGFDLQEFSGEIAGQFASRVHARMADGFRADGVKGAIRERPRAIQGLRNAGQYPEDAVRAGTYIGALRRGLSPDDAASWTAKHHFDYADLTNHERVVLKRLFPFWTFTARNTPLQATSVARRPGVYSNYGLAMEEGRKQADLPEDYQTRLPKFQQNQLSIPWNVKGSRILASPQLPLTDLQRPAAALRGDPLELFKQTIQMINPIAKLVGEPAMNYSAFFRGPIYQDDEHPEAPHYVPAPAYIKLLDDAIPGMARMFAGGNQDAADKGLWTAKADYYARAFPQSNAGTQALTSQPGSRSQSNLGALASQLSGVKINNYTPEKYRLNALYTKRNQIDAKINDARTLGKTAEGARLSKQKGKIQDDIKKARKAAGLKTPGPKKKSSSRGFGPVSGGSGSSGFGPKK